MDQNDSKDLVKQAKLISKLPFAIFKANSLNENPICVQSNLLHYKDGSCYQIYNNRSLLRLLAKKVELLTEKLSDELYDSSMEHELTIILNWKDSHYSYVTLDLKSPKDFKYVTENHKEIVSYFHGIIERYL